MSEVPTIKVVVQKKQLLADLNGLDRLVAEYSDLLRRVTGDEAWESDAISLLRAHQRFLSDTKISLRVIDLVSAIMRELLEKINLTEFNIRMGSEVRGGTGATHGVMLAETPEEANEKLENLIARVNSVAGNAPMAMQEKIRYLLLSTLNLMKCTVNDDLEGIEDCMTQINLVTSSKESQNLVKEIAIIARDIYNTLNTLSDGIPVIDALTESTEGISEAAKKLKAVVIKLEEAAFGNLDQLEKLTINVRGDEEICERVLEGLRKSQQILGELKAANPDKADQLSVLQDKLGDQIGSGVMMLKTRLHDNSETYLALTANQGFQDLTGQTLKKTIDFIESLELQLLEVLKKYKPLLEFSSDAVPAGQAPADEEVPKAISESGIKQSQDDVDQLLAELGF